MNRHFYYFGAFGEPGHRLYKEHMRYPDIRTETHVRLFGILDGTLVAAYTPAYRIILTNFEGIKYQVYSFVDYSSDTRGGSNANFFVPEEFFNNKDDELIQENFENMVYEYFPQLADRYSRKSLEFCFDVDPNLKFSFKGA